MKFIKEVKGQPVYKTEHIREMSDASAEVVLAKAEFKWAEVTPGLEKKLKEGVPADELFPAPGNIIAEKQILEAERDQLQATIQKQLEELEALKKQVKAPKQAKTED